jgi:hypothetical protein
MTPHLLKVRLQTFLSIPINQKCQILNFDTLAANERYIYKCRIIGRIEPPHSCQSVHKRVCIIWENILYLWSSFNAGEWRHGGSVHAFVISVRGRGEW